jgi:hypothetical protein
VGDGGPNILLLALFRATAGQNHQALAVFSQINSVSFEKLPRANLVTATATLAAA